MKKILLLCCFLLALKLLPAQTNRFSLAAGIGANQPVGTFGQKNIVQANAGFAKTGLSANIAATYMLGKIFGLTALLGAQDNGADTKAIATQMRQQTQQAEFTASGINAKHWQAIKFVAGGTIVLPLGSMHTWLFTARVTGGVLKTSLPQQAGLVMGGTSTSTYIEHAERSKISLPYTFAAMAGAGLAYNISTKMFLQGNIDYNYAAPQCKYPDFLQYGGGEFRSSTATSEPASSQYLYRHRQAMSNISLTVGAGLRL